MAEQNKNIDDSTAERVKRMLHKIEQFLTRTGTPPTRFGRIVARDPRLVLDMRRGREPGPAMVRRIEAFLAAQAEGDRR